jgi:UDP-N-acetylmuramoyl-tripeptide--D-alanyl-D-alanine ligase
MTLADMADALAQNYEPPPGRMHLLVGHHGSLIIDDTYNSSPAATEAALKTLAAVPAKGRKIAVLGDMMELGRFSAAEHRNAGALAAQCLKAGRRRASMLMTVGIRARELASAAYDAGLPESNIMQFEDAEEVGAELARLLKPGDVILIKGSQAMRLEKAVALIMAEPEHAPDLLVRQGPVWRRR